MLNFLGSPYSMSGYIIVQTAYGYTPREKDDYFVDISEKSLTYYLDAHNPSWLVNAIPLGQSRHS